MAVPVRSKYKNPVDPATGKPRRGRPKKVLPVDTIAGPQPEEKAVGVGATVPDDDDPIEFGPEVSTELAEIWKKRFGGSEMMSIPDEVKKKYPDGAFCWSRDARECVSKYRTQYGYEPVETAKPLPGQTDSAFRHGDCILMVRPKWMARLHDQTRREAVRQQTFGKSDKEREAEREALREARSSGYDGSQRNVSFETEDEPDQEAYEEERQLRLRMAKEAYKEDEDRPKGAKGRGSKFWGGGIPK